MHWNIFAFSVVSVSVLIGFGVIGTLQNDDSIIACDVDSKSSTCPTGMCCVRNESDFGQMYCTSLGDEGHACANYSSQFLCNCQDGYICQTDADGLFGTCKYKNLDIPCNISSRVDSCPVTHCCVRDEFLFTYTYCRPYGIDGSNCATRPSFYECPCRQGYVCKTNLVGGHINSAFGRCHLSTSPVG